MEPSTTSSKLPWVLLALILIVAAAVGGFFASQRLFPAKAPASTASPQEQVVTLKDGVYALEGSNTGSSSVTYFGSIRIEKIGEVYRLAWSIGQQIQDGVGILEGDILSVSYVDTTGETLNDVGVVSYKLKGDMLEGKWTSFYSERMGTEILTWKSE